MCHILLQTEKVIFELGGITKIAVQLFFFFCTLHIHVHHAISKSQVLSLTMISAKISGVVFPLMNQSLPLLYMEGATGVART